MTKGQQRSQALAKRNNLDDHFRNKVSKQLADHLAAILSLRDFIIIAGFWPIGSEIDPRPLLFALQKKGKILCLPAIIDSKLGKMQFRQFDNENRLVAMDFGTLGPAHNLPVLDPDLILLPLAAFDLKGHRIGYGGGFYDRAIHDMHKQQKKPFCLGLAFNCQEVDHIEAQSHDISLDAILTETGLRLF